ncbi:MAG: hypothetical protein ACREV0_07570, partial [Burkholderiales bacterium]
KDAGLRLPWGTILRPFPLPHNGARRATICPTYVGFERNSKTSSAMCGWCRPETAVSRRVRHDAPNSINFIRYEHTDNPHQCIIERWDYEAIAGEFKTVERSEIVLDRFQQQVTSS